MKSKIHQYFVDSSTNIEKFKINKQNESKINDLLADSLQTYLNQRYGMHTTLKMMLDFLKANFSEKVDSLADLNFKLAKINKPRITFILKNLLNYSYRSHYSRPPSAFQIHLIELRLQFPNFIQDFTRLGFNMIYVDEWSISTDNLSQKTWVKKGSYVPLIRPTDQNINWIAAHIMANKYAFLLKKSKTNSSHIITFFNMLDEMLRDTFNDFYSLYTIFVLDNAKVHVSKKCRKYFKSKKLSVLTLPPYTPEYNKVEHTFNLLKIQLKKASLYNSRLEHVVARIVTNL